MGPHLDHPGVKDLLTRYPTPQALKTAGRGRLKKHAPRAAERLTEAIFDALGQQSATLAGTGAAGIVLPKLAVRSKLPWRPTLSTRNRAGDPSLRNLDPR